MDWEQAIAEERAALGRIVALLVTLAGLAERAAGRSAAVRGLVLWLLRRAEAVARDYVDGADAPSAMMPVVPAGAGAEDALRLAISLLALARQLESQARLLAAMARRASGHPAASLPVRMPSVALAALSGLAALAFGAPCPARAPDTS